MNRTLALGCALLLFGAVGCSKKDKSNASPTSALASASAAAPADSVADSQIPTEEDYEEEAAQKVTAQNMDDQLDKLEKEIGQ